MMAHARSVRLNLKTAIDVPLWAFRFYLKHFLLIAGISIIPALQRFFWLFLNPSWSDTTIILLEVFVESTRLVLFWLIIRLAILQDGRLCTISERDKWMRVKAFVRFRWLSLFFQLILMVLFTFIFDTFLEHIVALWIPDNLDNEYLAIVLAIKNPTVIAWFSVWVVGIPRQMMLYSQEASKNGDYLPMF